MAIDTDGNELASATPATASDWTVTHYTSGFNRPGTGPPSCPAANSCVGPTPSSTDDPLHGTWVTWPAGNGKGYTAVSCPSTTLCVGVDADGGATTFTR